MNPDALAALLDEVNSASERTTAQIGSMERAVSAIVEASELTATDDEHDPEGATIAYERAQAMALLRQARLDLDRLRDAQARLESGRTIVCANCGRDIDTERLLALPTSIMCIDCARSGGLGDP